MKNFSYSKTELEENLKYKISDKKYNEILHLEFLGLTEDIKTRADLTFQNFNKLFVLGKGPTSVLKTTGKRMTQWWCICSCQEHNIILVKHNNLTSNNTKSCGCQNFEKRKMNIKKATQASILDLTNQRFGKLVALERTTKKKNNSYIWKCQCDCGNIHYAPAHYLNAGRCYSCGCLKESKGSLKLKELFKNSNIEYISEKTFEDCRFEDTNAYARFDFYLPQQNILIEYDGEQHFKELDKDFFRDSLSKRQDHDDYKNRWCLKNNIFLYRIPYFDIDNITSLKDILNDEYLIKEDI